MYRLYTAVYGENARRTECVRMVYHSLHKS
ncbi:Uncharacterised protein [Vibrio cholerae]|nr:Uncharacterised protein [Vibrio cholerae]